jgi:hypothetical protein
VDSKTRQQRYRQRQARLGHKRLTVSVPRSIVNAVDKEAKGRGVARDLIIAERLRDAMRSTRSVSLSEVETANWLEQLVTAVYAFSQLATVTKQRSVLHKVGLGCQIVADAYAAMPHDVQQTVAGQRLAVVIAKASAEGVLIRRAAEITPPPGGTGALRPSSDDGSLGVQNTAGASRTPESKAFAGSAAAGSHKPRRVRLKAWRHELGRGRKHRLVVVVAPSLREAARLVGETQRNFRLDWHEAHAPFIEDLVDKRGAGVWHTYTGGIRMTTAASFRPGPGRG